MKKKVLAVTMATLMAAPLTACGGDVRETTTADAAVATTAEEKAEDITAAGNRGETSAEIAETGAAKEAANGRLIMATNTEFPPYEYHDGDAVVGIDMEIVKVVADELGMKLEIEDIAFDSIIPEIVSDKADMGLVGMTVTEDHIQSVDFSSTYIKASQEIIITEDSEIASPDGLKGVVAGVQPGATGDIYTPNLEADGTTVERYDKGFEAVQALSQGKIDAATIDRGPAKTFVAEAQGLRILDESFTDEEYAIAVKKGSTGLLEEISGAPKALRDSGTLDEIIARYIKAE